MVSRLIAGGVFCLAAGLATAANIGHWLEKTTEFQLSNGLHVVVLERPSSTGVSLALLAKAGWADEPPGHRGLSRLLQLMVQEGGFAFGRKGPHGTSGAAPNDERKALADAEAMTDKWETEARKAEPDQLLASRLRVDAEAAMGRVSAMSETGEFRRQIEAAGGRLTSARTDATSMVISAALPVATADVWFAGMSEWIKDPSWREFYRHRQEAADQARFGDEQTALLTALTAKAFPKHAWAQPDVILEELAKLRIRDLAAFQHAAFGPGNLVLSVVGSMPAPAVRVLAEKYFGTLAAQPPMVHNWTDREGKPFSLPQARANFQVLALGYPRSELNSPDDAVLDVIAHLLTVGPDAYLQAKLVRPRKASSIAGAISFPTAAGGGLLCLVATPVPGGSFDDLRKAIQSALDGIATNPPTEAELLPAKRRFIASAVRILEEDGPAADLLARSVASLGSAKATADIIQQLEGITVADVQRVAKKYLRADAAVSLAWTGDRQ